tara:strand:+ start:656 stop:889 length:234 start_codon:yes stop_codon:yes gene_type:complete
MKTKEQYQKEIIEFLKTPVEEYSRDLVAAPSHGIARKTDNQYAGPEFFEALMDLVDQGVVEVIPTTGLTGDDWYRLA